MIELPVTAEFFASCRPGQLHDEASGQKRDWPASFLEQDDGTWVYRVDRDDVDPAEVQAAIDAHEPVWPPDPDEEMRDQLADFPAGGSPKQLADLLAGTDGGTRVPGRRP